MTALDRKPRGFNYTPEHPRCHAHSKTTGEQCGRFALPGMTVCRHHGGGAPQVKRKAEERLAEIRDDALTLLAFRVKREIERIEKAKADEVPESAIDYRDLLATAKEFTTLVELLAGRSTQRFEVHEVQPVFVALFQLGIECVAPEKRQRFLEGTRELTARLQLPETTTEGGNE